MAFSKRSFISPDVGEMTEDAWQEAFGYSALDAAGGQIAA